MGVPKDIMPSNQTIFKIATADRLSVAKERTILTSL